MRTLLLLGLTLVIACGGSPKRTTNLSAHGSEPDPATLEVTPKDFTAVGYLLDRLDVIAPVLDGYDRGDWKHWTDEDHDCQDTRQEVLIAESEVPVGFKTKKACKVAVGRWTCPYTGEVFADPSKLDVDHMIPLGAAHAAGGHAWDAERREAFANELGDAHHLVAVKASANRSKGKRGPEEWLPTNKGYVCEYVRNWIDIKVKWRLSVSHEERAAITATGCELSPARGPTTESLTPATSTTPQLQPTCPTTAACGCSKLRKGQCTTSCCKWTVGAGCGCR